MNLRKPPSQDSEHRRKRAVLYASESGARVRVLEVPERMLAQLARQGVRSGDVLKVINRAPMGGPILVEAKGAVVALGRAVARKIVVQALV